MFDLIENALMAASPSLSDDRVGQDRRYLLFGVPGARLFAVPAEPRELRQAALQQLHAFSAKRRAYKQLTEAALRVRMDRLLCRSVAAPLAAEQGFKLAAWLEEMRDAFGDPGLQGAIFWPRQSNRGRIYVHLFSAGLAPVGFAKLSLNVNNDACLNREAAVLRALKTQRFHGFSVPELVLEGTAGGNVFIVTRPVPLTAHPIGQRLDNYPLCIKELAAPPRHVPVEDVPRLSWWSHYKASLDDGCVAFHEALVSSLRGGLAVCRAHGDLTPANVLHDGEKFWILDWEASCEDAPLAADKLGFDLAVSGVASCSNPDACVKRFRQWWSALAPEPSPADLMPVLAFRHARGHKDAETIIRRWSSVR